MRLSTAFMVAVQVLAPAQSGTAFAASFKIIGDGMVQVQAYGETLVFREEDSKNVSFDRLIEPCYEMANGSAASLSAIFSNPTLRSCIERTTPDTSGKYGGVLEVRPKRQGDYVYPGHVEASAFPKFAYNFNDIRISLAVSGANYMCRQHITHRTPDQIGFVSQSFYSDSTQYELPAGLRKGNAWRSLCMQCSPILSNQKDQRCAISLTAPDGWTSLVFYWMILDFHGPDASWLTYDETARTIANSIFVDRPKGDLQ